MNMKKIEELKKKLEMMILKRKKLSPDDPNTIQARRDGEGNMRDYYILTPGLQKGIAYNAVLPITEDYENHYFAYRGLIPGADNAIGIIESNIPLNEIVANIDGNKLLQDMLKEENARAKRNKFYEMIGEEIKPLKNHMLFFGKPDFPLGKIIKDEKGKFTQEEASQKIIDILEKEREERARKEDLRDSKSIILNAGPELIVSEQDCWLEQEKDQFVYAGVNAEAIYYSFKPEASLKTSDGYYVYIGEVTIGEERQKVQKEGKIININKTKPYHYSNIVVWTQYQPLIKYFMEEKFNGLLEILGKMFMIHHLNNTPKESAEEKYIGGLSLNELRDCVKVDKVPDSVRKIVLNYFVNHRKNTFENTNEITEFEQKVKNAIKNIPNWIERGKKLIPAEKYKAWERFVKEEAIDIYYGRTIEEALEIMEALENNMPIQEVEKLFLNQSHSGTSFSRVKKIVYQFSKRGPEFYFTVTPQKDLLETKEDNHVNKQR